MNLQSSADLVRPVKESEAVVFRKRRLMQERKEGLKKEEEGERNSKMEFFVTGEEMVV